MTTIYSPRLTELTRFLLEDLAIPQESIAMAIRQSQETPHLLPMLLWQYGLVTIDQLDHIFDWLEKTHTDL